MRECRRRDAPDGGIEIGIGFGIVGDCGVGLSVPAPYGGIGIGIGIGVGRQ